METLDAAIGPKTHPATREMLPEDPLEMTGFELPGDPDLMLRLLVEEYARLGFGLEPIMQMAGDPFYQAFYGLYVFYGKDEMRRRIGATLSRVGVMRVRTFEAPLDEQLVQIETR